MKKLYTDIQRTLDSNLFTALVIFLILANAVIFGLETYLDIMKLYGEELYMLDRIILYFFVFEISLRIIGHGKAVLKKDKWIIFDAVVVGIALMPSYGVFSVLRLAYVFRVFMIISDSPRLRRVADSLLHAVPAVFYVTIILSVIFFAFAVMASKLFGGYFPEWFGNLDHSLVTLFHIATFQDTPEMINEIEGAYQHSWVFFAVFIPVVLFTMLNLVVAVIVDAINTSQKEENMNELKLISKINQDIEEIKAELANKK